MGHTSEYEYRAVANALDKIRSAAESSAMKDAVESLMTAFSAYDKMLSDKMQH